MDVKLASSLAELELVSPVLLQLRPQYSQADLIQQIQEQQKQGYQIAYVTEAGKVSCVAGFVIGTKLAWEKHLYVDDLVTDSTQRSSGAGKTLMQWLKHFALEQGCKQLHLDSGVQRFAAHRFYLREGFDIASHHFSISDLQSAVR